MSSTKVSLPVAVAAAALSALAAFAVASASKKRTKKVPPIKLTYFGIQGEAEKVRLAFTLGNIPFEDVVVPFSEWKELKSKTPYGQLPLLQIGEEEPIAQSYAMLRIAGRMSNGRDVFADEDVPAIEEALGFVADIERSWRIPVGIGIGPAKYGYEKGTEETNAAIKRVRETWVKEDCRNFMSLLTKKLEGKKFLIGSKVTIADCALVPKLNRMMSGGVDHVPTTCLDDFPVVKEYVSRFMSLKEVRAT